MDWDCSPSLHRHTHVDQLDSGIAVHSYTGIHMWISWTLGLQSIPTQAYTCGAVGLWDCMGQKCVFLKLILDHLGYLNK